MNKSEFGKIAMALRTYYPKENLIPNNEAFELWYEQLSDLEYKTATLAVKKWVATNKWSPSIAEIRETVATINNDSIKDWSEAYEDARQAIRRYGSYNPKDAMESLDELTRETVKRMGYYDMCMSENKASDRANFRDIYNILAQRKKQERQIPVIVLEAIASARQSLLDMRGKTDGI